MSGRDQRRLLRPQPGQRQRALTRPEGVLTSMWLPQRQERVLYAEESWANERPVMSIC